MDKGKRFVEFEGNEFPDNSGLHQFADFLIMSGISQNEAEGENPPAFKNSFPYRERIFFAGRERFFAKDVFRGVQCKDGLPGMMLVGGADKNPIHSGMSRQFGFGGVAFHVQAKSGKCRGLRKWIRIVNRLYLDADRRLFE